MEKDDNKLRIDKYLWAVRQYKTRSIATTACDQGKILINDQPAKASRIVRLGDTISVKRTGLTRTLKVIQLTTNRLPAKLVSEYCEDLTPLADIEAFKTRIARSGIYRDPGTGRPTKFDRRALDDFFDELSE
ncbi:MAG: RNA-binding S4 domain-containing protein [Bacteroidetes bacterium]|nr:RNA-binding S4 domain-containing protein [Bacteroidota bacterium]MBK9413010.1 RNA-binding S4 domain-containing protein [Bacteroidota bacterium]